MSHAKLSPSSAYRWLACPGSVVLIGDTVDQSSEFADEGTAAHTLAAGCLLHGYNADKRTQTSIDVRNEDGSLRRSFVVNDDMASYVQVYVDAVRDAAHGGELFVEQRLDTGLVSTRYGKITGTGDAIVLHPSGVIEVHDLKFGRGVKVEAANNPQLRLYGLGALHGYSWLGEFTHVKLCIHQPRLDHYSEELLTVAELEAWACDVRGDILAIDNGDETLTPGEKQCRFCPAASRCPALAKHTSKFMVDYADINDLTEHGIGAAMNEVELVERRCEAIRAEARRLLDAGTKVPGWCLEEGRAGNRKWSDEAMATRLLGDDAWKPKTLISPADAEKKFAKKNLPIWTALQQHIVRGPPSINMVRDDGQRKPLTRSATEDFPEVH